MTPFVIAEKTALTDRIAEFALRPADGAAPPQWSPGAHVEVDLGAAGQRSYSLIQWPGQDPGLLRIAVQNEPDGEGGSAAMHRLVPGDTLSLSAPQNSFALVEDPAPVALLAGGIGVTPMISMATALVTRGHPVVFHYAARSDGVMAYREALEGMLGERLVCHLDDTAPLDLPGTLSGLTDHQLYICGPKAMIEAARAAAEAAGHPPDRIHVELFSTPAQPGGDTAFEVELTSTGQVFTVPAGQSIIETLEAEGVDLIYDCQRGDCGICQVDVVSGIPDHRDVVLSQAEKDAGQVMQICVSRALSDRLVLDI